MPIGYVYKTTNLANGKIYIGQHQRDERDGAYFGSGYAIKSAVRKYGKIHFTMEVLCWADTIERLNAAEIAFIAAYDSCNPQIGYNISLGGVAWMKGRKHTEETKKKIGDASKRMYRSPEMYQRIAMAQKGKVISPGQREKLRIANTGRKMTEEQRKKNSESHKGKPVTWCSSKETCRRNSEAHKGQVPWNKGVKGQIAWNKGLRKGLS